MDVKLLLNDETSERPRICRFGPFEPQRCTNSAKQQVSPHQPQQRPQLPPLPNQQTRTSSYSSDSSSSSCSTSSHHHHHHSHSPPRSFASTHQHLHHHQRPRHSFAESLPPISSRVPPLARSDSGDSDRPHSPITPDTSPGSTPSLRLQQNTRALPSKTSSFIGTSLARPQILSHSSSYSAASSSGPPSSMDSFATNPANGFLGDMAFPPTHIAAQPYFNPQLPLATSPEQQHPPPPPQQQNTFPSNSPPASKPGQKKNSYPCPLARQFNCSEYFTTSGHAARHAKKHTGKKDAVCPECSKAFTRKDNMEQHRRTHSKDSSTASRSSSKPQADKDDSSSRQRKALKLQHQQQQSSSKKSRPSSLSAAPSTTTSSPANLNTTQLASPSTSSAVTSPSVDLIPTPNSMSANVATPLPLDLTLDPRLREGSVTSAPGSAFSPTGFRPQSSFAVAASPPLYNPPFQPGRPQQSFHIPQQQILPQHHRHSSMNMVSTQPISSPLSSLAAHSPQHHSLPQSPFGNSIDFGAPQQPLGLGMTLPASAGIELGMPNALPMMLDETGLPINPNLPLLGVAGDLQAQGLHMPGPPIDKLALDKLAMAAEAASQSGR